MERNAADAVDPAHLLDGEKETLQPHHVEHLGAAGA
jgi:hypothetical protein